MSEVIAHSDNTGMVFVGRKLGRDKLLPYLNKFGFGQKRVSIYRKNPKQF